VSTIESKRQSVLAVVLLLSSNLFLNHTDSSTDGIGQYSRERIASHVTFLLGDNSGQYCRERIASLVTFLIGDNSGLSILSFTGEYYRIETTISTCCCFIVIF
jgi:hypothetical protein